MNMKKLVFPLVLCLVASVSFGQKKVLNDAKREIGNTPPNVEEARKLIKAALSNPETEESAEAWYVAGSIENKQFDEERAKEIIGIEANSSVMYEALDAVLPYFEKAYELDNLPNEKNRVRPKYTKDIRAVMKANRIYYINAGSYFYDKQDWEKAYKSFKTYAYMPELPLMAGEKWDKVDSDTLVTQIKYFAALSASAIPDRQTAIQILSEIRNDGYEENEIYQRLVYEYEQEKDSVNFIVTLKEGFLKFPRESYYILNLINESIKREDFSEAIDLLNNAIASTPNDPQLYDVLGTLYENSNEPEKAIQSLQKALEIDPTYASALKHMGMVYYNQGVKARASADAIVSDNKLYEEEYNKGLDFYKQALPHLEKSFELNKEDSETIYCLRFIYYSLNMGEEFEKIDALFSAEE